MSWESERPNMILTLENIDELERIYTSSSQIFPGCHQDHYYVIKSHDPNYVYGICTAKNIFKALKKFMKKQAFKGGKDKEYVNHWRWFPRNMNYAGDGEKSHPEGGYIMHYYNSREPNDDDVSQREFTRLEEMNQNTKDEWNQMNSNVIKPPFYRGGDPLTKLGLGIGLDNLWWCESNRSIAFTKYTKEEIILEI